MPLSLRYAMKANNSPALLKFLLSMGVGVDCVSPGEVYLATGLGFAADAILFTPFDISIAELDEIPSRVTLNVGSIAVLERLVSAGKSFFSLYRMTEYSTHLMLLLNE